MVSETIEIVEGVSGVWFYHLSEDGKNTLCGNKHFMPTCLSIATWGMKTHVNEKYCKECTEVYQQMTDKTFYEQVRKISPR